MFDFPLTFGEYVTRETPTLAEVFRVVFDHLRIRDDAVLFGSHAVNAYVEPPRATGDVDILSTDAQGVAEDLRDLLAKKFHIAVRIRSVAHGRGWRVYQLRKPKNRHLVDVRQVDALPAIRQIEGVHVVVPSELVMLKLESYVDRKHTEKGLTDKVDLYRLLRAFPLLRAARGPVGAKLADADPAVRAAWQEILNQPLEPTDDDAW
jgi:hypothetical protein